MDKLKHIATGESENLTSDYVAERLVRLVSVGLKEATMDSPSFRASLNYTHISILQCYHQMEKSLGVMQRYITSWNNFLRSSGEVEQLFQPYINDIQFISNDVSKPCITEFLKGQNIIFDSAMSLLKVDDTSFVSVKQLLEYDIPVYFELRRNFENIQNKYDIVSAKFMQLPKGYNPGKTREDALQLFEIRKQYIHISMSLWICVKQLENRISKTVTDISDSFWNSFDSKTNKYGAKLSDAIGLTDVVYSIKQLNLCADLQSDSSNLLLNDLNRARKNSEEGAIKMYTPSSDLKDFDSSILNDTNVFIESEDDNNKILEKHGWVFIKSQKLNSKYDVWIKRWMFIKNGVFGFLSISQDGQYVQESDKIGVLLVSVKYLPNEDRKFCFKISSELTNLNIQVETVLELKSWLTVFRNNTQIAIDEDSKIALKRYSPALSMLKLVPVVAKDLELIDVVKTDPQVEKTSKLIELQLSNLKFNLSINPPLKTSMTEKLAMSHLYLSSTTIPSASTANFWGYVNWGLYFVLDEETKVKIMQNSKNIEPKTVINLRYPNFYPESLRVADAELRSIFEVFVGNDEYTLLRFNASWSPNSDQTLFCTIYLTTNSYYVYSHTCGLISLLPIPLSNLLDVEIVKRGEKNILKIYFVNGLSLKMQTYSDDILIIRNRVNYILNNNKAKNPDDFQTVINKLVHIETNELKLRDNKRNHILSNFNNDGSLDQVKGVNSTHLLDNLDNIHDDKKSGISSIDVEKKINYTPEMHLLLIKKVKIPSKALFHMLFGDESILLQCTLPLASSIFKDDHLKHSLWRCDSKQKMSRVVWNAIFKVPCALQTIERIDNNKYYNVVQETPYLRFVFGINKKIIMRFVIYNVDSKTSKLMVYYSLGDETSNVLNWFTRKVTHQIMLFRIEALEKKLDEALKQIINVNRKISTSIQLFGPITKYDSNEMTKEEGLFEKSVYFVPLQLFSTFYYEKLNFEFERLVISFFRKLKKNIKLLFRFLNANMIFVSIFLISIILNLLLIGRSSSSYWREKNINNHIKQLTGEHYLMERSVGIKEIDDMIYPNSTDLSFVAQGSDCYWKFLEQENLLSLNEYSRMEQDEVDVYNVDLLRGQREISLAKKLTGLRIERNDILTKLNLLNYLEREFIIKEWTEWVSSEISNCERVKELYPESFDSIREYCNESEKEMIHLYNTLL